MSTKWHCESCRTRHSFSGKNSKKQYIYAYCSGNGERKAYTCCKSMLDKLSMPNDPYCLVCMKTIQPECIIVYKSHNVELEIYMLLCSAECMHVCKKITMEFPGTDVECEVCHKTFKKIKTCGRCKRAYYCSVACQRADWPVHKLQCFVSTLTK